MLKLSIQNSLQSMRVYPRAGLLTSTESTTATFADDTAVLATDSDPGIASQKLQINLDAIQK
jgi:hypothetical protein